MGPFLNNGESAVSEEILSVFDGTGPQQLEKASAQSKWNMYNLELCKQPEWEQLINNETSMT